MTNLILTAFFLGPALLPIFIFAAIAATAIFFSIHFENKRTEKLEAVASELGLDFSAESDPQLLDKLQSFPTFRRGRSRKMKNLMQAETEDTRLAIFEYSFRTGSGKSKKTHRHTIAAMERPSLRFPRFSVTPEGFFQRIGSAFGFQDIDFEQHPEFSNAFVLKGDDETAIRNFFETRILDLFVSKKDAYVEADDNLVIFRRRRGRVKPEQIADFMAEAFEFLNAFDARNATD